MSFFKPDLKFDLNQVIEPEQFQRYLRWLPTTIALVCFALGVGSLNPTLAVYYPKAVHEHMFYIVVLGAFFTLICILQIAYMLTRWVCRVCYLKGLTPVQKERLRRYTSQGTRTRRFPIDDGVVIGLEQDGILHHVEAGKMIAGFDFNMEGWAYKYLMNHPEILKEEDSQSTPHRQRRMIGRRIY